MSNTTLYIPNPQKMERRKSELIDARIHVIESQEKASDLLADGSIELSADWDIGNGRKILADQIRARDVDGLKLTDDANNGIFIEDGGNVGIASANPAALLEVGGDVGFDGEIRVVSDAGRVVVIEAADSGNDAHIGTESNSSLNIVTNDTIRATYHSNGRFGINTTTPSALLEVKGDITNAAEINLTSDAGRIITIEAADSGNDAHIGTESNSSLNIVTNDTVRVTVHSNGRMGVGTTSPSALLDVNSDIIRLRTAKTPASAGAAGNAGDIAWDSSFIYVCVAANTWKRAGLSTW